MPATTNITATDALRHLMAGNARFVANDRQPVSHGVSNAIHDRPIAIVLGCCDHRVTPETVFDQGLGSLFTIRVAGNIVTPSQMGSIEYGVAEHGTRLIVVLGHQHCGAINAALTTEPHPGYASPGLSEILTTVRNQIGSRQHATATDAADVQDLMIENVRNSVHQLRTGSELLANLSQYEGLQIIGAHYSMDTGKVRFLDR